ncbi:MAG TPA: PQQ-like beta-propeller repeat protein [Phycisphaerae bacterium]|nr:PQQ-like beta-propeller repeat protein [Phycisphaerae bacterium]
MQNSKLIAIAAFVSGTVALGSAVRADWTNFRGANYDGISNETGFVKEWKDPIPLVWERDIGSAFSSFAIVGDRLYTCGTSEDQQTLYCLNATTGEVIWLNRFEPLFRDNFGDGTRATPTVAHGKVYVQGAKGKLICVDAETGKDVWSHQFNHMPQWGYSGSVLVEGDLAISSAGDNEGALIAFDRITGAMKWHTGSDPAGYSTPYPFTFNDKRYIVGFNGESAIVVEAKTGRQVLRIPWQTNYKVNAASPIFHDGHLFLTSGYDTGCGLFKLDVDGKDLVATEVWKGKVLMNKFQSCILYKGDLYSCDQKALACVDFKTGEEKWRVPRVKHGTLLLADDHLLLLTQSGRLQIAPVSPKGFEAITDAEILSGKCWTVSVLDDGKLYARNMSRVVCMDLTKKAEKPTE